MIDFGAEYLNDFSRIVVVRNNKQRITHLRNLCHRVDVCFFVFVGIYNIFSAAFKFKNMIKIGAVDEA